MFTVIRVGGVRLVLDQAVLNDLINSPQGPMGKELGRIGAQVEGRAKQLLSGELVGVDTGRLRASTAWKLFVRGNQLGVSISAGTEYAKFVHDGTRFLVSRPFLSIAARDVLGKSVG